MVLHDVNDRQRNIFRGGVGDAEGEGGKVDHPGELLDPVILGGIIDPGFQQVHQALGPDLWWAVVRVSFKRIQKTKGCEGLIHEIKPQTLK